MREHGRPRTMNVYKPVETPVKEALSQVTAR